MTGAAALALALLAATPHGPVTPPAVAFDLAAAIAAAGSGDTVVVPAGVHAAPIVVDKPLTIEGRPGAVVQGPHRGDVLRVTAPGVVIRGLVVRGTGTSLDQENAGITVLASDVTVEDVVLEDVLFGIYLKDAPRGVLRRNRIRGMDLELGRRGDAIRLWKSDGTRLEGNVVSDARDVVIWFCSDVTVRGNRVTHGRYGLHFMYADSARLEGNWLEENSVGAFLMYSRNLDVEGNVFVRNRGPSGYGIGLKDMDGVRARDNRFLGNRIGVYLDNSPWSVNVWDDFERNVFAYNDVGVAFLPAVRRNRFADNAFLENVEQVAVLGAGDFVGNDFTPDGRGNFWSDYAGYDLANDGTGDVPYRAESLFENLMDREKNLRLFLFSPAQQTIELAAKALPAIRPRPKVEDVAPRMAPTPVRATPLPVPARWPFAALAVVLGAGALLTVGGAARGVSARAARQLAEDERPASPAESSAGRSDAASDDALVRIAGLRKRFGRFAALDGVDVEVRRGESVALWGRNGAGKTTAIRCLLGLHRHEGEIRVAGLDTRRSGKEVRRLLGYVPQELAFHDDMRTRETLEFYARLKKVDPSRPERVLADVGMAEHAAKRIRELSGGMKQRVALAAALLADPPILVLDEMTSNLDQAGRAGFLRLLAQLKTNGKTILFTSHRLDEVRLLADRVVVLERGRIRAVCTPAELPRALDLAVSLRVRVGRESLDAATTALRAAGFDPSVNGGDEVKVRTALERKLDVLRTLDRAGVAARDFEVETEGLLAESGSAPDRPGEG